MLKPKIVLVSALLAATTGALVVLLGLPRALAPAASPTPPDAPDHTASVFQASVSSASAAPAAPARPAHPSISSAVAHPLDIPPERWAEARRRAQEMADNLPAYRSTLTDPDYAHHSLASGNDAQKIALRLALPPETADELAAIFAAERAAAIELRMQAERERLEREARLLAQDRESYIGYLALEAMLGAGATLSEEQSALHRRIQNIVTPSTTTASDDTSTTQTAWYENASVLAAVNQRLSPEQSAGLAVYVAEQKTREQATRDMHARMRASRIAEQLGLNQADESVLHDYLRESPDASHGDLAALLPTELRELLPAGM